MNIAADERRREQRIASEGLITLSLDRNSETRTIEARLIDISESGFRARHQCMTLAGNQQIAFRSGLRRGKARVVWNRIVGTEVETGFFVIARS